MNRASVVVTGPCYDGVDEENCRRMSYEQGKYIDKCLNLAHKSNLTQKHGCVIVRRKKIISCGYNFKIQNTFLVNNRNPTPHLKTELEHHQCKNSDIFSVHAEISTLKKVKNQDLSECDMYVVRLGPINTREKEKPFRKSNSLNTKYSLHCKVCNAYIQQCASKKVYYSDYP